MSSLFFVFFFVFVVVIVRRRRCSLFSSLFGVFVVVVGIVVVVVVTVVVVLCLLLVSSSVICVGCWLLVVFVVAVVAAVSWSSRPTVGRRRCFIVEVTFVVARSLSLWHSCAVGRDCWVPLRKSTTKHRTAQASKHKKETNNCRSKRRLGLCGHRVVGHHHNTQHRLTMSAAASLRGKNILVNGAWGAAAAIARHAASRGASVSVLLDSLESRILGKSQADADGLRKDLSNSDIRVLDCNSEDLDTLKSACQTVGSAASGNTGGIDVLVHVPSVGDTRGLQDLPTDQFTAIQTAGLRRSFWTTRYAIDHGRLADESESSSAEKQSKHVLSVTPPLHLDADTFITAGVGHSMARFNLSMASMGLAQELKQVGVAVNAVWPEHLSSLDDALEAEGESPNDFSSLARAAEWIVSQDGATCNGTFFTDTAVVANHGDDNGTGTNDGSQRSFFLPTTSVPGAGVGDPVPNGSRFEGRMPADPSQFAAFGEGPKSDPGAASSLTGKTVFITGGSRGIGQAIAERASRDGANVVLAAKTDTPHPKLPGTIHTVAESCLELGAAGALPLKLNIQDDDGIAVSAQCCTCFAFAALVAGKFVCSCL